MIVRVGLLDKSDNYISRLANYQNVHSNEAVQFEIYLFTEEQMLRRQMGRGGRIDVLIAEEELLQSPEEYARSMELAFWSEDKHEQMRDGYPVICRRHLSYYSRTCLQTRQRFLKLCAAGKWKNLPVPWRCGWCGL